MRQWGRVILMRQRATMSTEMQHRHSKANESLINKWQCK